MKGPGPWEKVWQEDKKSDDSKYLENLEVNEKSG